MKRFDYYVMWLISRFEVTRRAWIKGMTYHTAQGNVIEFNRALPLNAAIGYTQNVNYEGELRISVDGIEIPYA